MEKFQQQIFAMMVRKEELLSELYAVFSVRFKEFEPFWDKMAKEELEHAAWLRKLQEAEEKKLVTFDEGKIKTYTMETFLTSLEETLVAARAGKISAKKAFSITLDIERSLIESNTFQHFESFSEEGENILTLLNAEVRKHVELVSEMKRKFG